MCMLLWVPLQYNLNYWRGGKVGKVRWTFLCNWILHFLLSSISSLYILVYPGTPRMGHHSASSMFIEGGEDKHQSWHQPFYCGLCADIRSRHNYVGWHFAKILTTSNLIKGWSSSRLQGEQESISHEVEGGFLLFQGLYILVCHLLSLV